MLQGLYAAASGMAAQQATMDAVSNDIANSDTTGYQAERVGFHDLLYTSGGADNNMSVATGAGSAAVVLGRDQSQGNVQMTGQPLDVALQGEGFIAVTEPSGQIGLTRSGVLQLDPQGRITTSLGYPLSPPVTVPPGTTPSQISIAQNGDIEINRGQVIGKLSIVTVPSPDNLLAQGNSLFTPTAASGAPRPAVGTVVTQGALESSNVSLTQEMAAMINAQRSYAMDSKAIDFQNQMLQIADQIKK